MNITYNRKVMCIMNTEINDHNVLNKANGVNVGIYSALYLLAI